MTFSNGYNKLTICEPFDNIDNYLV